MCGPGGESANGGEAPNGGSESVFCEISDLRAVCEEVAHEHRVDTNEVAGRRRRKRRGECENIAVQTITKAS